MDLGPDGGNDSPSGADQDFRAWGAPGYQNLPARG